MSDDIIQRVTKAVREAREMSLCGVCDRIPHIARCTCNEIAYAAIRAMRKPTESMILAGVHHDNMGDMEGRWKAMIDAALTERA
jgi:hypothetical protein